MIRLQFAQKVSLFRSIVQNGHRYPIQLLIILLAMIIPVAVVIAQTVHPASSQPSHPSQAMQPRQSQPLGTLEQRLEIDAHLADDPSRPIINPPATRPALRTLADLQSLIDTHNKIDSIVTLAVQPEPTLAKYFLVASTNEASAKAFNCYFSFYFNWTTDPPASEQYLANHWPILMVDRLFFERNRARATQDQSFSDPEIVSELEQWIAQLIDPDQSAAISAFILDCYRQNYRQRLAPAEPGNGSQSDSATVWQQSRQFGRLEVTYHADREIYWTFRLV